MPSGGYGLNLAERWSKAWCKEWIRCFDDYARAAYEEWDL